MPLSGPGLLTGFPSTLMLPLLGCSKPAIRRRIVLLPDPELPTKAMNSPDCMANDNRSRISFSPNRLLRLLTISSMAQTAHLQLSRSSSLNPMSMAKPIRPSTINSAKI